MKEQLEPEPALAKIEEEVLAEGREWTRRRIQQKLQIGLRMPVLFPSTERALVRRQRRKPTQENSVDPVDIQAVAVSRSRTFFTIPRSAFCLDMRLVFDNVSSSQSTTITIVENQLIKC
jgi:hypothetical protein